MDQESILADRQKLVEERRKRKKLKREQKREEKLKKHEKALLSKPPTLQPTNQYLSIIKSDQIHNPDKTTTCNNQRSDFKLSNDEFPDFGTNKVSHIRNKHSQNCLLNSKEEIGETSSDVKKLKRSKRPICIDIGTVLQSPPKPLIKPNENHKSKPNVLAGNYLDSDRPERKRGKHREIEKPKPLSKLKNQIIQSRTEHVNDETKQIPVLQIREYCDNVITPELNTTMENFITMIVNFQSRLYKQDPQKGFQKRRYVVGFHEVEKYLAIEKLKLIIIAPNLQACDVLNEKVESLKYTAILHKIPYVFALHRRLLGKLTCRNVPVSCLGILNYSGAESQFQEILKLLNEARVVETPYSVAQERDNDPNKKVIVSLMKTISI